jgi:hypothetical protein
MVRKSVLYRNRAEVRVSHSRRRRVDRRRGDTGVSADEKGAQQQRRDNGALEQGAAAGKRDSFGERLRHLCGRGRQQRRMPDRDMDLRPVRDDQLHPHCLRYRVRETKAATIACERGGNSGGDGWVMALAGRAGATRG